MNTSQETIHQQECCPQCCKEYETYKIETVQKIENFKSILQRAKLSLDKQKIEIQEKNSVNQKLQQKNHELDVLTEKLIKERTELQNQKEIQYQDISEIIGKIVIDKNTWFSVKFKNNDTQWFNESQWDDDQYDTKNQGQTLDFQQALQNEQKLKSIEKQHKSDMENIIMQYEDRVLRMQNNIEENENKIKQFKERIEKSKQSLDIIIHQIIDESEEIRENCLFYLAEETDQTTKMESLNKVKYLLIRLEQLSFPYEYTPISDIKNNILILHQTLFDTLKKFHAQIEENQVQEIKWKRICTKIDIDRQNIEKDKIEIEKIFTNKINDLNNTIDRIKGETLLQLKERDVKIEFLSKELKKNVNVQYIKNILIKFFLSTDQIFREKTLPVIATVLQFTSQELENVKEQLFQKQTIMGKIFGFSNNK